MYVSDKKNTIVKVDYLIVLSYAVFLFFLHFVRLFDNNFWADEAFTINLVHSNIFNIIKITAADVHPPLYYLIVKLFCEIFGYTGMVYHLVSFVPYVVLLCLGITVIWSWFGKETSIIFITFASLLTTSVQMIVEVRMYTWSGLFIMISFLCLYKILTENKILYWTLFVVASLCAAYIHYYCLISVAFFYIFIIFHALFRAQHTIKRMLVMCVITILGYLPWFFVLLESFMRSKEDFWLEEPQEILYCLEYIFQSKFSLFYLVVFLFGVICLTIRDNIFDKDKRNKDMLIWIFAGASSLFGTMIVGTAISLLVRPMFIARYLFPISVVIWMLLGIVISRFKYKRIFAIIITCMMMLSGLQEYNRVYLKEKQSNETLEETLEVTTAMMDSDDIIVTDNMYIIWAVAETYYPENECIPIRDFDKLADLNETYWFILSEKLDNSQIEVWEQSGFVVELIKRKGVLGTYPVSIYKFSKH